MILVLEDNPRRIELMREALASLPVELELVTFNSVGALSKDLTKLLPGARLVSLDYDLLDSTTRNPGNGMDAVQALSRYQPSCPVIIHTSLVAEGEMMARALRGRDWKVQRVLFNNPEAALDWCDAVEEAVCRSLTS